MSGSVGVPELLVAGREVRTVFDLLGTNENDLTYALGWGLRQSGSLRSLVLARLVPEIETGEVLAIRLQQHNRTDRGFTDIEIATTAGLLIVEAKAGYAMPTEQQLARYRPRFDDPSVPPGGWTRLVVLSGWDADQGAARTASSEREFEVDYLAWREIVDLVRDAATQARGHAEKRLLHELASYLSGGTAMRDTNSNKAYVLALSENSWEWLQGSFIDFTEQHRMYFHPAGVRGWPKEPPNYLAFRYRAKLQSIHHVDEFKLITRPHEHLPFELGPEWAEWEFDVPHFLYWLGPPIKPQERVASKMTMATRAWADIDLLLTSGSIKDAVSETKVRT